MSENLHYTAKIFLYEIEPLIWRRVSFPADSTFEELHDIIQKAMGWGCEQGHEFLHGKGKKLDQIIGSLDNDHAKSSFFQKRQQKYTYLTAYKILPSCPSDSYVMMIVSQYSKKERSTYTRTKSVSSVVTEIMKMVYGTWNNQLNSLKPQQ